MTLKVLFRGFWPGFSPQKPVGQFFLQILNETFKQEGGVVPTDRFEEASILFESCFDGTAIPWRKWRATFFYSGESYALPNWRDYSVALWGEDHSQSKNIVSLPLYPLYLLDLGEPPESSPHRSHVPPKDVLVMISNPGGATRNAFLEELTKSSLQITYAGKYKNNIGGPFPHAFGSPEFAQFASQFKFIVTMENSQQSTYITEKVLQGLFAENIPVYWGAPRISDYINEKRILILNDAASIKETIKRMCELAADPAQWLETVRQPWHGPLADTLTPTCLAEKVKLILRK